MTVEIAGMGSAEGLAGKSTSGAPCSLNPTSMPRVAAVKTRLSVRDCSVLSAMSSLPLVLKDLLAFHRDVLAGFDIYRAGPFDGDVLALNCDGAVLFHVDTGATCFQQDLIPGRHGQRFADRE